MTNDRVQLFKEIKEFEDCASSVGTPRSVDTGSDGSGDQPVCGQPSSQTGRTARPTDKDKPTKMSKVAKMSKMSRVLSGCEGGNIARQDATSQCLDARAASSDAPLRLGALA